MCRKGNKFDKKGGENMSRKKYVRQDNLAGILKKHDIKHGELSQMVGYKPATLSKLINGHRDISMSLANVIMEAVNKETGQNYTKDDLFM